MDTIREYLLSVTAAAMLCAVARRMLDKKGTPGAVGKLLTGLFMTFTVLSPLVGFSFGSVRDLTEDHEQLAQAAVQSGEKYASEALRESITEQLEAYVLDKADAMGAHIKVEITLSKDIYPVPEKIRISGQVAPYAKDRLKQIIKEELGVLEENQIWT